MTDAGLTLAVNGGSSTVKCALFTFEASPRLVARCALEGTGPDVAAQVLAWLDDRARGRSLSAVAHRLVHGGPTFRDPQRMTTAVIEDLEALVAFAPNHLPQE